ncbi:hypothetical protein [Cytobacillus oceanisediminis]|uniref:hypothetical protein n=1 Tax=Cytobacillus oceanisediminis TaxID=665099 RepID=UPI001C21FD7B|nr:hypothetical protein [Cytobacillus oceanisediminis]MBU8772022.1 hypothetical protein [Cytobacillus oceanisediminis]
MYFQDSLEYKSENIYHQKTREYFNEVMSSYNNGNYRSAVVMLYSVVICDLIYKLQELSDRYSDHIAISILEKIKQEQEENPTNPKWEKTLIDEVSTRTNLLEPQDKLNINYLRDSRHLSAHPVLDRLDILVKPNKETVRANMANMLDGLLCKSPILSNKIINTLLADLVSIEEQLVKQEDLERYLNSKYLTKINKPTEEKLFRDLWKFAFRLEDAQTNKHRIVIYNSLLILFRKELSFFVSLIQNDKNYYSQITLENPYILDLMLNFWSRYPVTYLHMDETVKVIIDNKVRENFDLFAKSVFLSDSLIEHFSKIRTRSSSEDFTPRMRDTETALLFSLSREQGITKEFLDLLIFLFRKSSSYSDGDYNFREFIIPYGKLFTKEQFIEILTAINENNQLYGRWDSRKDNPRLKKIIDESPYKDEFDYTQYSNFRF